METNLLLASAETYSQKTQETLIGNQTLQSRTKPSKSVCNLYTIYIYYTYKRSGDAVQRLNFLHGCWVKP